MIYLVLYLSTILASYYFAFAQRTRDTPYMWLERNLVLVFMGNSISSFYLYEFGIEAFSDQSFVLTLFIASSLLAILFFNYFYAVLKPVAVNKYVYTK